MTTERNGLWKIVLGSILTVFVTVVLTMLGYLLTISDKVHAAECETIRTTEAVKRIDERHDMMITMLRSELAKIEARLGQVDVRLQSIESRLPRPVASP